MIDELRAGLILIIDNNEDRQVENDKEEQNDSKGVSFYNNGKYFSL